MGGLSSLSMSDLNQLDRTLTRILEESWEVFWKDVLVYLLATVLSAVLIAASLGILSGVVAVGFSLLVHRRLAGEEAGASTIFAGFSHLMGATIAALIIFVGVSLGLLLLLLPGLFLLAAWSMTFHAMAVENLGAGEAMSRSYRVFKEHSLLIVVLLILLAVVNSIAGTLIFLPLLTTPYSAIAVSIAYERLAASSTSADELRPFDVSR